MNIINRTSINFIYSKNAIAATKCSGCSLIFVPDYLWSFVEAAQHNICANVSINVIQPKRMLLLLAFCNTALRTNLRLCFIKSARTTLV